MSTMQQLAGLLATVLVLVLTRLIDKYTNSGSPTTQVDKTSQLTDPVDTPSEGGPDHG